MAMTTEDEILSTLKRIEKKLNDSATVSQRQWQFSLGIGVIVASLAVLPHNVWGAVGVFIAGYLLMIFSRSKKKV